MERLQKVLGNAGIASRRKSEKLIQNGRVKVNGQVVTELGTKVDPEHDQITVDEKVVQFENKVYYLFYKPTGVISSVSDPHGRKVVLEYFQHSKERIYPIGRLDRDTSGLLLLTNDGDLVHQLLHPSYELDKVYIAIVKGTPTKDKLDQLAKGVKLVDGWTAPAKVEQINENEVQNVAIIRLTIHEGRNRQVRRMCKVIGHPVLKLHREQFGFLTLEGLKMGESRALTPQEVEKLRCRVT